jgi:hypothetical protein
VTQSSYILPTGLDRAAIRAEVKLVGVDDAWRLPLSCASGSNDRLILTCRSRAASDRGSPATLFQVRSSLSYRGQPCDGSLHQEESQ